MKKITPAEKHVRRSEIRTKILVNVKKRYYKCEEFD
jgi:hypothetical protein